MSNIIKPDWSWNRDNNTYTKPVIKKKKTEKQLYREMTRKIHHARRSAKAAVYIAKSAPSNIEYANALWSNGIIEGGPFNKKAAVVALVTWYESLPKAEKIPKPEKKRLSPDQFYSSPEWRKLRYLALLNNGRVCQCCGAKPPDVVLHVDHVKPRSRYPHLELCLDNLQILCEDCNMGKGAWDSTDFR